MNDWQTGPAGPSHVSHSAETASGDTRIGVYSRRTRFEPSCAAGKELGLRLSGYARSTSPRLLLRMAGL